MAGKRKELKVEEEMDETMKNTIWCSYCLFGGCGFMRTNCRDPVLCGGGTKCFCVESYCTDASCYTEDEGFVMGVQKLCCCISTYSFPPGGSKHDGIPCCALCNIRCGGEEEDDTPSTQKAILNDAFLCFNVCCYGCGVAWPRPFSLGRWKCCYVHGGENTADCWDSDSGCIYSKAKCLCCVVAGACPPGGGKHDGIPCCALCGLKCGGEDAADSSSDSDLREPMQQEMK